SLVFSPAALRRPPPPMAVPLETEVRSATWQTPYATGAELTSAHYRVYSTATDRVLGRNLCAFMEAARNNYLALTGLDDVPAAEPMTIYMLGTREEWAALTRHVVKEHVELYLGIQAGGYCYRGVGVFWDIGRQASLSVASHEGLHQFLHHRLRSRLPMWLEEGLCTTAEGFDLYGNAVRFTPDVNRARFADLRKMIGRREWIAMRELLPMDAGDAIARNPYRSVGYYGQLWALVQFLRSRPDYRAGMHRLIRDAEKGRFALTNSDGEALNGGRLYNRLVSEPLFRSYISDDLDAFDREFRAFALELAKL
ncbi:MAG TPA: DUF1570 domain-containing protein, partial [Phycisphaerae bacterium]|nr:DUF1570 domain-containing protein [Phycisphaerae bacterium]